MARRFIALMALAFSLSVIIPSAHAVTPKETPSPVSITFLTFNVCLVTCQAPAPSWDVRRERVTRIIAESGASVIALQEATNMPVPQAKTQWQDILNLVSPAGYTTPVVPYAANDCDWHKHYNCINGDRILFKPSDVHQVSTPNGSPSAGITTLGAINPTMDERSSKRTVSWAYLQGNASSTPFLVVGLHLPTEKDSAREEARQAAARNLGAWTDAMNLTHGFPVETPVVLLADLNSYSARQPGGAQRILTDSGWTDSWNAPARSNIQYASVNHQPQNESLWHGFPPRPYSYKKGIGSRIDYVMVRHGLIPLVYEHLLWLNPDGTFKPEYQASDHQPVRVTLGFPG